MANIGEVLTGDDLKQISKMSSQLPSKQSYLAPTLYRPANAVGVPRWNYYKTFQEAILYNKGGKPKALGSVNFTGTQSQTMGINVDFFAHDKTKGESWAVPYEFIKNYYSEKKVKSYIARFFKTEGSGPYYSCIYTDSIAITAISIDKVGSAKLAALDALHRELQISKTKYNTLAAFLSIQSKKKLTAGQQQVYNEGLLTLNKFERELRNIKGANITFGSNGQVSGIGFVPIIWIAIIVISGIVAAFSINKILSVVKDVKLVNAGYDMQKFSATQMLEIDKAEKAGLITATQAATQKAVLVKAAEAAQANIEEATKEKSGIFDKIQNLALIGLGFLIITKFVK